jgi:hypothetical protein
MLGIPDPSRRFGNPKKLGFHGAASYPSRVASLRELTRCRERLEGLGGSNLDCEAVQREAISELARVVGFDRWCWPFADPRTLVPLGGIADHDYGPRLRRALELEFSVPTSPPSIWWPGVRAESAHSAPRPAVTSGARRGGTR